MIGELAIKSAKATVWTARLTDPAMGRTSLQVAAVVLGYEVVDRLERGLIVGDTYALSAKDERGVNIESGFNFSPKELREGQILDRSKRLTDVQGWLAGKPSCR